MNTDDLLVLPLNYVYKDAPAGSVRIRRQVLEQMMRYMAPEQGAQFQERGGILGMQKGVITHFQADRAGGATENSYRPSAELGQVIRTWARQGIEFGCLCHSHRHSLQLSAGDLRYVRKQLAANASKIRCFLLGVVKGRQFVIYRFDSDFCKEEFL